LQARSSVADEHRRLLAALAKLALSTAVPPPSGVPQTLGEFGALFHRHLSRLERVLLPEYSALPGARKDVPKLFEGEHQTLRVLAHQVTDHLASGERPAALAALENLAMLLSANRCHEVLLVDPLLMRNANGERLVHALRAA
jgi:hypothetical protein